MRGLGPLDPLLMGGVLAALAAPGLALLPGYLRAGPAHVAVASLVGVASSILLGVLVLGPLGIYRPGALVLAALAVAIVVARLPGEAGGLRPESVPRSPAAWVPVAQILAMAIPVYLAVGSRTSLGEAYPFAWNFDGFTHLAGLGGLLEGGLPPRDLQGAGGILRYTWFVYLVPAELMAWTDGHVLPLEALKITSGAVAVLLALSLYGVAARLVGCPRKAATAIVLLYLSLSLDGLTGLVGIPDPARRNFEAVDFWMLFGIPFQFHGGTFWRTALYVPHHQLALALLTAWAFLSLDGPTRDSPRSLVARAMALLPMPGISILVSAVGGAGLWLVELHRARTSRRWMSFLVASTALGTGLAMVVAYGMLGGSGWWHSNPGSIRTPMPGMPLAHLVVLGLQMVTTFGAILPLGMLGILELRRHHDSTAAAMVPGLLAAAMVWILVADFWIGGWVRVDLQLKASYVMQIALAWGAAAALAAPPGGPRRQLVLASAGFLAMLGLATPVMDLAFHLDLGPGGSSVYVRAEERQALDWIREHTPPDAMFQAYPYDLCYFGGPGNRLPVFAGRRLRAARWNANTPKATLAAVEAMFASGQASVLAGECRALGIRFLYLDDLLDGPLGEGAFLRLLAEVRSAPRDFRPVFGTSLVQVFEVLPATD